MITNELFEDIKLDLDGSLSGSLSLVEDHIKWEYDVFGTVIEYDDLNDFLLETAYTDMDMIIECFKELNIENYEFTPVEFDETISFFYVEFH